MVLHVDSVIAHRLDGEELGTSEVGHGNITRFIEVKNTLKYLYYNVDMIRGGRVYLMEFVVVCRLSCVKIWLLWNSTVREEMFKVFAISFAVRPSASSCRTSRRRWCVPPECSVVERKTLSMSLVINGVI